MPWRRGALVIAAGLMVTVMGGCPRRADPVPRLVEARVDYRGAGDEAAFDPLAARAATRLCGGGLLRAALGEPPRQGREGKDARDYKLLVEVQVLEARGDGERLLRALVSARLLRAGTGADEPPLRSEAIAERELAGGQRADEALVRAHVERAVDDVVDGLGRLVRLRLGGSEERLAALRSDDAELRREAARVVGERKERAAVPVLLPMLKDERPEYRDLALGALIEIGDPAAARPIAEMARLGDAAQVPRIIDAMASLGGGEARAYLEFVISAHDDEEMRSLARAALVRLDAREGRGGAAGPPAAPWRSAP